MLNHTAFDYIVLADGSCKKNGKLFLFLGNNVFCKLADLYFALVSLIKPVIHEVSCGWLFSSLNVYQFETWP